MDPLLHFTRHLIVASGKIDLKLPERKELQIPSIINTPFYESLFAKKEPTITKALEASPAVAAAVPEVKSPQFSTGNPKIDSIMSDPDITSIHYEPLQPIRIRKGAVTSPTDIFLDEGEANELVKRFSEASGTPLSTVFRSKLGNHSISAILSPIAGIRFLILRI